MLSKKKELALDALYLLCGTFLYAAGVCCFTAPNEIAPGGVSGISTMINALTQIPMGVLTMAFNVPLLILAFFFVGRMFAGKTLLSIGLISIFMDVVLVRFPVYRGDMILGAIFGGVLMGVGLALVFMRDFTSGGSDIIARMNSARLVILDDLGAERNTDYALEKIYNIIDSRYRRKLPMLLTTNLTIDEMKDEEDRRYSRVYDRIFETCYSMQFTGPSWRKKEARRRFTEMEKLFDND